METVSSITQAISNAILGDGSKDESHKQEPASGEIGNTAAGEPYDKGNAEPSTATNTTSSGKEPGAEELGSTTVGEKFDKGNEGITESTATTTSLPNDTADAALATGAIESEPDTSKTGVALKQDPASAASTTTAPNAEAKQAVDISGPSPIPLEQDAKQDNSNTEKADVGTSTLPKDSAATGTGNDVKTGGVDVGAAQPSAGLVEQTTTPDAAAPRKSSPSPDTPSSKNGKSPKPSLKEKIKGKLHLDRHKN